MEDVIELAAREKNELLDIFRSEEDKKGTDLLKMSNFLDIFLDKTIEKIRVGTKWSTFNEKNIMCGNIITTIKTGFDISGMETWIADTSHFDKEIIEGLKNGVYKWKEAKEVEGTGNIRPAVLDENGRVVKFVTLKRAVNPTNISSDLSTLSMQASLKSISMQLERIEGNVENIIEFQRRNELANKFLYARDKIKLAVSAEKTEWKEYLKEADTYLMEGLTNLYSDLDAEIKKLVDWKNVVKGLETVDDILTHIHEDLLMILRYVGLRIYLFEIRGNIKDAYDVLNDFCYKLERLESQKIGKGKYTAFEIIHKFYPYNKTNVDFWLEEPKKMIEGLNRCETMLKQDSKNVFYIEMEDEVCE